MAEYLEQYIEDVKNYVQKKYTFRQISDIFKQHFPGLVEVSRRETFGYSVQSVE
jgi:hypothetical protein